MVKYLLLLSLVLVVLAQDYDDIEEFEETEETFEENSIEEPDMIADDFQQQWQDFVVRITS